MAEYIKKTSRTTRIKRGLFKPLAVLFIALIAGTGAISSTSAIKQEAASADIISDLVCDGPTNMPWLEWAGPDGDAPLFGEGSLTHTIYRVTHTDDLHFALESKSTVNAGTENVDSLFNLFITLGDAEKYVKTNEDILGVDLTTSIPIEGATANGGSQVTAFDRFGLSGLSWTRYNGEWRYPYVDVCSDGEPRDLKLAVFYEDRLEPLTTYDGIKDTKDIRTAQFGNGIAANLGEGFLNTTANWTFTITKGIVAVAIALVNLSFSDFTELLGLNDLIGSDEGIFANLYKGIYQPFIGIVMAFLGLLMLYRGIVKRQYRGALGLLARSIALFIASIIMFAAPMTFVTLPNNAAVVLQSLIINTMSTGMASGSGICTVGGTASTIVETNPTAPSSVTDADEAQSLLTTASQNMRSVVGCQLWSTFLVKPWSLGQFGADYNKLYSEGHIPSGTYGATGEVKTDNEAMVGDAAVPVGGGQFIYNWALFQISTGTNAHSPLINKEADAPPAETPPTLSVYTNGVANDWYRVVDAMANYNEKETEIQDSVTASNNPEPIAAIRFAEPDLDKKPTEFWSTWVGGNSLQRIGIAFTSIIAALAGLLTVIVFGFLSAIYGFGIVIVMAFAPLFFLAGSWGDRGWEAFKSWAQLLLNLVVKRVMIGTILVLNLVLLTTVLNMMSDQDYFWGVAAMALVSIMLWKFKDKIIDTVGGLFTFSFANENMESKAQKFTGTLKGNVRKATDGVSNVGVAALAGGIAASRNGAGFSKGWTSGFKQELKTQSYRMNNSVLRQANLVSETLGEPLNADSEICPFCGQTLESVLGSGGGTVMTDGAGNKYHMGCAEEQWGGMEEIPSDWMVQQVTFDTSGVTKPSEAKFARVTSHVDLIQEDNLKISLKPLTRNVEPAGVLVGKALNKDLSNPGTIPEIPKILEPYLADSRTFIDSCIRSGDPRRIEEVVLLYAKALVAYAYAEGDASVGEFSKSPSFEGSLEADQEAIYSDMIRQIK